MAEATTHAHPLAAHVGRFLGSDADDTPGGVVVTDLNITHDEGKDGSNPKMYAEIGGLATHSFASDKSFTHAEVFDSPYYVRDRVEINAGDNNWKFGVLTKVFKFAEPLLDRPDEWERFFEDAPNSVYHEIVGKRVLFAVKQQEKAGKGGVMETVYYTNLHAPYGETVKAGKGGLDAMRKIVAKTKAKQKQAASFSFGDNAEAEAPAAAGKF